MLTRGRLGPLTDPRFRLFWIGSTASTVGDALMPVTLVFAILSVGGSTSDIGMVLATSIAVRVLLLVIGGTLADRLPRRLLMVGCDVVLAVVQIAVGILLFTGQGSIGLLLTASVLYGAASAMSKPAMTGLVPQTITKDRLQQANALVSISRSTAHIIGPALAGLLVAAGSPALTYLIDAGTFMVSAVTLVLLKIAPVARDKKESFLQDIAAGWHEIVSRPWYWIGLCCHATWNLGACVFLVLGPVIVNNEMGGASSWGLVAASTATGSLLGGFAVLRWKPRRPLVAGHLALLLTVPQLASLIGPSPILLIMASSLFAAIGVTFINQLWTTAMQQLIPEHAISRVSSYDWLVSFTVAPLGYAMVGPLSEYAGISVTVGIAMALVAASVVAVLMVPGIRAVRQGRDGAMVVRSATEQEPEQEPEISTALR
jgi:MFS family permease